MGVFLGPYTTTSDMKISTDHPGFEPGTYGFQADALPNELIDQWFDVHVILDLKISQNDNS